MSDPLPPPLPSPYEDNPYPPDLPPPPPLRESRSGGMWMLALACVVVVVVAGIGTFAWMNARRSPRAPEDRAAKHRETAGAFSSAGSSASVADTKIDAAGIESLLAAFGQALRDRRGAAARELFDIDRMAEELKRVPEFPKLSYREERAMTDGLGQGMSNMIANPNGTPPWHSVEVKLVKPLAASDEALVYAKHRCADDLTLRMRWWVRKSSGRWRVYDFEDLDGAMRATSTMGRLLAGGGDKVLAAQADIQAIQRSLRQIGAGDVAGADVTLAQVAKRRLPRDFDALRHMATGSVRVQQQRWDEALDHLAKASRLNPDMPMIHLLRAAAYNGLGKYDQAVQSARQYAEMVGTSDLGCFQEGIALQNLDRLDEAADAYRAGLDDEPGSVDCLVQLALVLPEDHRAELVERFARSPMTREVFRAVANQLTAESNAAALRAVCEAYRKKHGPGLDPDYFDALAGYHLKDYAGAAAALESMLQASDAYYRSSVLTVYLDARLELGQAVDGYRKTAARRPEAMKYLSEYLFQKSPEQLQDVIELHLKDYPDEPNAWYWLARLLTDQEMFSDAEQAYAAAYEKNGGLDAELGQTIVHGRAYALYRMNEAERAYRELSAGGSPAVFDQLARLYMIDGDAEGHRKLIDLHRATEPSDPHLPLWVAEAHFISGEYAQAGELLEQHRDVARANEERALFPYDDHLVRCLVRQQRHADALAAAQRIADDYGDPYYLAMAHASAGDVSATVAAVSRCIEESDYVAADFYADEDIGPALESAAFAPFRAAHPKEAPAPATTTTTTTTTIPATQPAAADVEAP
jgi:tetratricopeptide (TPR) repeat protein